jgi:hypothetical protein
MYNGVAQSKLVVGKILKCTQKAYLSLKSIQIQPNYLSPNLIEPLGKIIALVPSILWPTLLFRGAI